LRITGSTAGTSCARSIVDGQHLNVIVNFNDSHATGPSWSYE